MSSHYLILLCDQTLAPCNGYTLYKTSYKYSRIGQVSRDFSSTITRFFLFSEKGKTERTSRYQRI